MRTLICLPNVCKGLKSFCQKILCEIRVLLKQLILQVNTLEATDDSQILASGDRIEIFSKPKEQKLSKKELELQREKLKRLFGHSPSGYGSSPSGYGYSPKTKIEPSRMGSASLV